MADTFSIGPWNFDPSDGSLRAEGEDRRLEHRAALALQLLCQRRGEVVSKEELIAEVWQGRSVSPNSVAVVIGDLRRALGDNSTAPIHIVTVQKRGYRLTGLARPPALARTQGRYRRGLPWIIAAVVAALFLGRLALPAAEVDLAIEPVANETQQAMLDGLARSLDAVVTDSAYHLHSMRILPFGSRMAPTAGTVWVMQSRLILWNGAPELAMTVVERATGKLVWSAFAAGPPAQLAKNVNARIATLETKLAHR